FYGGISQVMDETSVSTAAVETTTPVAPIKNPADNQFFQNMHEDLQSIDAGWDDLIEHTGKSKTQVEELEEIDAGWDEIIDENTQQEKIRGEKLIVDRAEFDQTGVVKFDLPQGKTTREENSLLIPELIKRVQELMPEADAKV